jgi:hypothetical protein
MEGKERNGLLKDGIHTSNHPAMTLTLFYVQVKRTNIYRLCVLVQWAWLVSLAQLD